MIYTTNFASLKKLPDSIIPVAICRNVPEWYKGAEYKALAPSFEILRDWWSNHNEAAYKNEFDKILSKLNPENVKYDLESLANGKDIALLCFERAGAFCHRHLVADWFSSNDIPCREYTW